MVNPRMERREKIPINKGVSIEINGKQYFVSIDKYDQRDQQDHSKGKGVQKRGNTFKKPVPLVFYAVDLIQSIGDPHKSLGAGPECGDHCDRQQGARSLMIRFIDPAGEDCIQIAGNNGLQHTDHIFFRQWGVF